MKRHSELLELINALKNIEEYDRLKSLMKELVGKQIFYTDPWKTNILAEVISIKKHSMTITLRDVKQLLKWEVDIDTIPIHHVLELDTFKQDDPASKNHEWYLNALIKEMEEAGLPLYTVYDFTTNYLNTKKNR